MTQHRKVHPMKLLIEIGGGTRYSPQGGNVVETIFFELNCLGDSSQQELDAYRNIGSIRHLKRLKRQEIRRNRQLKQTKKALKNLFFGACVAFDIWIFSSWVDIILHNTQTEPAYQVWNFFNLLF